MLNKYIEPTSTNIIIKTAKNAKYKMNNIIILIQQNSEQIIPAHFTIRIELYEIFDKYKEFGKAQFEKKIIY